MSSPQTILVWDIETNVAARVPTDIHLVVTRDLRTDQVMVFRSHQLEAAVDHLNSADVLVGHNSIMFDTVVIEKISGRKITPTQLDTLLISRLLHPDLKAHPAGGNSLGNWGAYLNMPKDEYKSWCEARGLDPWSEWRQEMQDYCIQDTLVTTQLYKHLAPEAALIKRAVMLEHEVARVINKQIETGMGYNLESAIELEHQLRDESKKITEDLRKLFEDKIEDQRYHKTTGKPLLQKIEVFNPGSRQQIATRLIEVYGWKPKTHTPGGSPQVDESVLAQLSYPAAKMLSRYLMLEKRLSQLAQWFQYCEEGVIHGGVITNGTVSGRMSHQKPNLAQIPKPGKPFGEECRSLFGPIPGYTYQVGVDAAALELRMLAHYMAHWDNGEYARKVLETDIHVANQEAAGLATRDQAKTFIFAMIYGAGDFKLGRDFGDGSKAYGKKLRDAFLDANPAFRKLRDAVAFKVAKVGVLVGLDGRPLPIRSPHMAMNLLLQSAGAVIMKQALVLLSKRLPEDAHFMANVHDEWQICCKTNPEGIGKMAVDAIRQAGEDYNLNIPMSGNYLIGTNWRECH
jgi:DNA polymerase I